MRDDDRTMSGIQVGICEDDTGLRSVLRRALLSEGFEVRTTSTGHEAVELFSEHPPDLLVLDIGLPDADGRDVCQALRGHGVSAPVLFLTARDALPDRLSGFPAGGDDSLTKPFALAELLVRARALLRRSPPDQPHAEGALRLDPAAHAVRLGDRVASLTPTEYRLLATLAARPGAVLRRRELVSAAWPEGAIVHENTPGPYVGRRRRKRRELGSEQEIVTMRGVGYTLR